MPGSGYFDTRIPQRRHGKLFRHHCAGTSSAAAHSLGFHFVESDMCAPGSKYDLAALQSLMALIFNLIIADVFATTERDITPDLRLIDDLQMTAAQQSELEALLAESFDGIRLEWRSETTLGDIYMRVVEQPFSCRGSVVHDPSIDFVAPNKFD